MVFFCFIFTFGGLVVCVCAGEGRGGGGGGAWEFAPPHFLPNPIHIYLYGCGG